MAHHCVDDSDVRTAIKWLRYYPAKLDHAFIGMSIEYEACMPRFLHLVREYLHIIIDLNKVYDLYEVGRLLQEERWIKICSQKEIDWLVERYSLSEEVNNLFDARRITRLVLHGDAFNLRAYDGLHPASLLHDMAVFLFYAGVSLHAVV